jgi:hypothetical protein
LGSIAARLGFPMKVMRTTYQSMLYVPGLSAAIAKQDLNGLATSRKGYFCPWDEDAEAVLLEESRHEIEL